MILLARLAALGVASLTTLSAIPGPDAGGRSGGDVEHPGAALFARHCAACHTLGGGPGMGPDLAGVTLRRPSAWLIRWIDDPAAALRSDSAAADLVRQWGGRVMPDMDLSGPQILELVDFLTAVDAGEIGEDVLADANTAAGRACRMRGARRHGMGAGMGRGPCACPMHGDSTRGPGAGQGHGGHP